MIKTTYDFAGKVALITGASSGIGRATALGFAANGATVVLADIDADRGEAVRQEIENAGGSAVFHQSDMTDPSQIDALFGMIKHRFPRLDYAHNNVGFSWGQGLLDISIEDWNRTIDLCLKSPFLCMQHEVRMMRETGGGAIVNTASMAGVRYAAPANAAYSAAKAGVIHMTAHVAVRHAADNIRVNAVSPGLVRTEAITKLMTADQEKALAIETQPIGRSVLPEEIAASVLWLCSDGAAMVTGENIRVAGGGQI